ncbi:xanthine dehydrogenase family protein molybdopterin-binding subunit [Steroidobacter sp. S1-65]|uniref:Xanthine dehydrogenase family protein molybdopterin-binding subunit n=1 Tax=Steroidobacter gossypii TaxID=2805490 RepID=A0ABS1X629_9GAMM|nr:xanthine dehydrogenase family protein molybdopterin-binding subunit [Steroidobacter gossypii]MBM0108678.1 xanthine dehydrogenase family protein molybdopterin-binding subunit [Steroidobacter gossypii]
MSAAERDAVIQASRRDILKGGGALTVAMWLPTGGARANDADVKKAGAFAPNAFVRIDKDSTVTVLSKHTEMGQGAYTGLATIVAEELDADWSQIRVEGAPADAKLYNNFAFGPFQGTGGSTAISNSYDQLKTAGATARALLVTAAANRWQVPASEITIASGVVQHKSGKSARFGELVADAAKLPVPTDVKPKDPSTYNRIGKSAPRVDSRAKSTGKAIFTQDFKLPGMLTAVVVHPPRFGGKVKSFDASKAKQVKGVKAVVSFETPARSGVAVVATDFWSAKKGRDALSVEWDESSAFKQSSDELLKQYRELTQKPGDIARKEGDVETAFASAARTFEATYEFPYLAHAAMEPMNCVAKIGQGSCEIWNGEQFQTADQMAIAKLLGIAPKDVKINQLYAGGSFGRRANPLSDYLVETVAIAKAMGTTDPVKLVWTREDDMRAGYYRPMYVHWMKAGVDAQGKLIAWQHRIVGQSITAGTLFASKDPIDFTSVEGAKNLPYHVPNLQVELHTTKPQVPVLWWRSVGSTHTAFATECFLDDIARATKQDPYALRRSLLEKHPRHVGVLDLVAEKSGWKKKRAADEVYGLALHESFNSVVGQVVKLKKTPNGPKLVSVVCAVDCGIAVNPNIVAMQMESGIGYGLSAALTGAVTFKEGRVEQGNFDDYPVLRINEMPAVETHIVPSKNKPTGVGEPGTPVIAPALANALALIDGKPVRSLPLSSAGVRLA